MGRNLARAAKLLERLHASFISKQGVFSNTDELLENQIPSGVEPLSVEHANFLFYLISQDHGTKSKSLYLRAKQLHSVDSGIFDPSYVTSNFHEWNAESLVQRTGRALGTRYPFQTAKSWLINSRLLLGQFDGDARNVFLRSQSSREAFTRILGFHGFGPKIGGLLYRVFIGLGFAHFSDQDAVAIPVDIHDTRIAFLTRIIWSDVDPQGLTSENYAPFVKLAQDTWRSGCRKASLNWLEIDRALWILGSKGCAAHRHDDCCLKQYCIKGH